MTNLLVTTPRSPDSSTGLINAAPTASEQAVLNLLPAGALWLRARYGVRRNRGFQWEAFNRQVSVQAYDRNGPVTVSGPGPTRPALRTGAGDPLYTGTNRGAMRIPSASPALGVSGWTCWHLLRVPTVASGEVATPGGYVWRGQLGPADNSNPGFSISQSTGRPTLIGGGKSITDPRHAGVSIDMRDGLWHLYQGLYDGVTDFLRLYVDNAYATGSSTAATTDPDTTTYPDILSPIIGVYAPAATPPVPGASNFINYFQGDHAEHIFVPTINANGGSLDTAVKALILDQYGDVVTLT
jgi:hypothetical protein